MSPSRTTAATDAADGQLVAREAAALLPTYGRQPVAFASGHGPWLVDTAGNEHLDFVSGLAVTNLGHAHPEVADAVAEQARRLAHTSNLYYTEPQIALAERLQATLGWPDGQAFFANSGAEANEAALKLARRYGKSRDDAKVRVVALSGGFHGRTLATLAATVCAVWLEVVQGEAGVRPLRADVLAAARAACDRHDALLVVDEVQTGLGRLGSWYGFQQPVGESGVTPEAAGERVAPDVVCLAKALANGLPIGAMVARGEATKAFGPGDHASTFGGQPVVCAAANTVIDVIQRDGLVAAAAERGAPLRARLDRLAVDHDDVVAARGQGLLQALVLADARAEEVVAAALDRHLIVNAVAPGVVRLSPPLIVDESLTDRAVEGLTAALDDVRHEPRARG
ncbi:MAG: hypothetical protein BRC32_02315 [Actinobacteria bacterium QS_8_72_14]|nr:MAG: hypothetical protein BRC32_02315 [Actinobacteria bacterium QS_8_72_14]